VTQKHSVLVGNDKVTFDHVLLLVVVVEQPEGVLLPRLARHRQVSLIMNKISGAIPVFLEVRIDPRAELRQVRFQHLELLIDLAIEFVLGISLDAAAVPRGDLSAAFGLCAVLAARLL